MFVSNERVEERFLVDDLNDLVQLHCDLINSYEDAIDKLQSPQLRDQFMALKHEHDAGINVLRDVIEDHGGEAKLEPDVAVISARMRVIVGRLLSDRGVVRALLTSEQKLLGEYVKDLRSLTYISGLEQALRNNGQEVQTRVQRLEQLLGEDA